MPPELTVPLPGAGLPALPESDELRAFCKWASWEPPGRLESKRREAKHRVCSFIPSAARSLMIVLHSITDHLLFPDQFIHFIPSFKTRRVWACELPDPGVGPGGAEMQSPDPALTVRPRKMAAHS